MEKQKHKEDVGVIKKKIKNEMIKWENIPILQSSTLDDIKDDLLYNFELDIDKNTGLVFQKNIPNQEILYKYSRNSAIGKVWKNHHNDFYNFIINNIDLENKDICEIGSGSGYLAKKISKKYKIDCYEPSPNFKSNSNISIIKKFFNDTDIRKYDVIILSHTLEHVPNIDNFLLMIKNRLNTNGKLVLSFPNLSKGLENDYINIFPTEHISFFTVKSTERILNKNYFQNCIIKEYNNHSIFSISELFSYNTYKKCDNSEISLIKKEINDYYNRLLKKIDLTKNLLEKENKIYIFGCHVMTSIFIYLSKIDQKKIISILDNDPLKHNKRLYGTNLYCRAPSEVEKGTILLNGSTYHDEIKKSLLEKNFSIIDWKK